MKKQLILELIIAVLVALFLYASFSKYADFDYFKKSMHNQPFPAWFSDFLIDTIPPFEIMIVIALIFEKSRMLALRSYITLMSLFTLYILAIKLNLFKNIPCSCGGIIRKLNWEQHLVLNLFFLILAVVAFQLNRKIRENKLYRC